jgi:hypothetical protein
MFAKCKTRKEHDTDGKQSEYCLFRIHVHLEDGGPIFLRNVSEIVPIYKVPYHSHSCEKLNSEEGLCFSEAAQSVRRWLGP